MADNYLISKIYDDWNNEQDYSSYMTCVKRLKELGYYNEYRIFEHYRSSDSLSEKDWPNLAVCALLSEDPLIKRISIHLISDMPKDIAIPTLSYIYAQSPEEPERELCLEGIGRFKDKKTINFIVYVYNNEHSFRMKVICCFILGTINSDRSAFFLEDVINKEKSASIIEQALQALNDIKGVMAARVLKKIVLNKSLRVGVRIQAFTSLLSKKPHMAKESIKHLYDEEEILKVVEEKVANIEESKVESGVESKEVL